MIIVLFILFLLLDFFTFYLFNKDVMAPPFIFCVMYTVSIIFALTEYKDWELNTYSVTAFNIYLGGALIFIFIGYVIYKLSNLSYKGTSEYVDNITLTKINYNRYFLVLLIIIDTIALILLIRDVKSIAGSGSLTQTLENFRQMSSYSADYQLPGYDNQLMKIVTVSAYICIFILINNRLVLGKKIKSFLLWLPMIIYVLYSIYMSNRLYIIEFIAGAVVYYCLLKKVQNKYKNISTKSLFIIAIVFVILLLSFSIFRMLFGRTDTADTQSYLSVYIGGPVKLFDLYVKNPVHSDFWGKETFYGLFRNLRSLGLISLNDYIPHKEFRFVNGMGIGNVYSAYRPYIADFGYKGLVILQMFFSIFFNTIYFSMQRHEYYKKPFLIILYGYIIMPVFMHPIDDEFYRMFFNLGFIIYMIIFGIIYIGMTKKIKIREF